MHNSKNKYLSLSKLQYSERQLNICICLILFKYFITKPNTKKNPSKTNDSTTTKQPKLPSDLFLVLFSCSCTHLWALPILSWPGHGARPNSGLARWGHFLYRQVQCYQHISTGRVAESSSSCGFSGNTKGITKGSKSLLSARECKSKAEDSLWAGQTLLQPEGGQQPGGLSEQHHAKGNGWTPGIESYHAELQRSLGRL